MLVTVLNEALEFELAVVEITVEVELLPEVETLKELELDDEDELAEIVGFEEEEDEELVEAVVEDLPERATYTAVPATAIITIYTIANTTGVIGLIRRNFISGLRFPLSVGQNISQINLVLRRGRNQFLVTIRLIELEISRKHLND
jgi:hypothetical protein